MTMSRPGSSTPRQNSTSRPASAPARPTWRRSSSFWRKSRSTTSSRSTPRIPKTSSAWGRTRRCVSWGANIRCRLQTRSRRFRRRRDPSSTLCSTPSTSFPSMPSSAPNAKKSTRAHFSRHACSRTSTPWRRFSPQASSAAPAWCRSSTRISIFRQPPPTSRSPLHMTRRSWRMRTSPCRCTSSP